MCDIRIQRWADLLVNYSLQAKKGQYAVLTGDVEAQPLLEACYESFLRAGVNVEVFLFPRSWTEILMARGNDEQIGFTSPGFLHAVERCDLYLTIGAEANGKLLANVLPAKQSLASKARQPILKAILDRAAKGEVNWTLTHFPTAAAAQEANMGTREYEEFIFHLGHLNEENPTKIWQQFEAEQQKLVEFMDKTKILRFQNPQGTDLEVSVEGMKWMNSCGKRNFPDGEIFTGPNLNASNGGVNGIARFSFPTLYRNVEVDKIELVFENGAVKEAKAEKGEPFLREMIQQDPGARYVGEIAVGTNHNMNKITKNILFDEKFGGTFHLALGKGYPQTGNSNQSALHWDMIFDLRQNGSITADGKLIYKNGKFVEGLY